MQKLERKLSPGVANVPSRVHRTKEPVSRLGIGRAAVLDVETTGFASTDEIIELGIVAFDFSYATGRVLHISEEYTGLRQPSVDIPSAARQVHGIEDSMVRGRALDTERIRSILTRVDFIVAHNASFDYRFVTRMYPWAAEIPWLCSMRHIPWTSYGFPTRRLQYLLAAHDIEVEVAHRALDDCLSTLKLLQSKDPSGRRHLLQLVTAMPSAPEIQPG